MEQQQFPPPGQHDPVTEIFPAPQRQQHPTNQNDHVSPPPLPPPPNQQNITPPPDHRINRVSQNDNSVQSKPMQQDSYPPPPMQPNYGYPQQQQQMVGPNSKITPQPFPPQYPPYQQQNQFYHPPLGPQFPVGPSPMPGPQFLVRPSPMPGQQFPVGPSPMPGPFPAGSSPMPLQPVTFQPWTTGLFDCAQDMENTLITMFCPCITFGQIADIVDQGMTTCSTAAIMYWFIFSCSGLQWIYSWMYRTRLRTQYSLQEDPFHDCLVHFLCEYCALCQEYRELKNRGFNMELGYIGNMQQAQMQAAAQQMPPPVQEMAR